MVRSRDRFLCRTRTLEDPLRRFRSHTERQETIRTRSNVRISLVVQMFCRRRLFRLRLLQMESHCLFPRDTHRNSASVSAVALLEVNKCMQKACLELKTISGQIKIMRKRMEEDERVTCSSYSFLLLFDEDVPQCRRPFCRRREI